MLYATLHIGTEKTGSSSIQRTLDHNRERLKDLGIAYPKSHWAAGHERLAVYAAGEPGRFNAQSRAGVVDRSTLEDFRARCRDELYAEVNRDAARCRHFVFSTEYAHSILTADEEVQRLSDLLAPLFDHIDVVVYLRRQDELAVSAYSTRIKDGGTHREILPPANPGDPYFNYDALLARWAAVFGDERIQPRLYLRDCLRDGNVVADFLAFCGIEDASILSTAGAVNPSLSAEAQEFIRQMNIHLPRPPEDYFNRARGNMSAIVARAFAGEGRLPTRQAAADFLAVFDESNERVRRKWFPDRTELFPKDFSRYPASEPDPPTFDQAVAIAAELWRAHLTQTSELQARLALRDGQLAAKNADVEAARRHFERAAELAPNERERLVAVNHIERLARTAVRAGPLWRRLRHMLRRYRN